MSWLPRLFFALVVLVAAGAVLGGTACTRRGGTSTVPPTNAPLTTLYVNPLTGSDSTGNGSSPKPYKTLTKAINVVKGSMTSGLTVQLEPGDYNTSTGEVFPIVVPTGVTIAGTGYNPAIRKAGSYIDGWGEDTTYEKLAHKTAGTAFATLEVPAAATQVAINNVFIGSAKLNVLPAASEYAAIDDLGTLSVSSATFVAGSVTGRPGISGLIVPSGTFSCTACIINGTERAIGAFTLPGASSAPNVTLGGQPSQSKINGLGGIQTDGTANVDVSNQTFQARTYAFKDDLIPLVSPGPSATPLAGVVDFGYGDASPPSTGGNTLIGASVTEIWVTLSSTVVSALGNTWNSNQQNSNPFGQYQVDRFFYSTTKSGKNVTVNTNATGAFVEVGPVPPPTVAPSPTPTPGPTPTASPT